MKLWLISQNENTGYATFNSAVVAAESAKEARRINPRTGGPLDENSAHDWVTDPNFVSCQCLGTAANDIKKNQIILTRLNAY
jgi:hypothetical protein